LISVHAIFLIVVFVILGGITVVVYQTVRLSPPPENVSRMLVTVLALLGTVAFAVLFLYGSVVSMMTEPWVLEIAQKHFAASVGLPFAALAALCLVSVLEIRSGPVEFEAWGLKFKGAAAPIVFWILIFLAIAASIKLLWSLS
jgi:hypothetical protein